MLYESVSLQDIPELLRLSAPEDLKRLYESAYRVKVREVGSVVYFRGIIEYSNVCSKNCYYCGIRRGNAKTGRYTMTDEEVIAGGLMAYEQGFGSIVLQSGENSSPEFAARIERLVSALKSRTNGELGITLSLGEQTRETYRRWFDAGAHRYLLRIETSSEELYAKLHPPDHSFRERRQCLETLRETGYQVGTGVMIGLPYQTVEDLASDVEFFRRMDIDMIGMGPFVYHADTPLAPVTDNSEAARNARLELALKMIAVTRLYLPDVNIASTTALQALAPLGRERGIKAGANIIMPNITPQKYREDYLLYQGKPCTDEEATECLECLVKRIEMIGETVGFGKWGDSRHFSKRGGAPS